MKIVYAAGNTISSKYQLKRFLSHMNSTDSIKVAAYQKSSPSNISVDWTLDCLLNSLKTQLPSISYNENYNIYKEIVKGYSPDLIISDLELFTSEIGFELKIPVIQCSSHLLWKALTNRSKYNLGICSFNRYLYSNDLNKNIYLSKLFEKSYQNYIYSHYGDLENPPDLEKGYQWITPYHLVAKKSIVSEHEIVGVSPNNDIDVLNVLQNYDDAILFNNNSNYNYDNINIKNLDNEEEYISNVRNAETLICEANATFLADAFYNGHHPIYSVDDWSFDSVVHGLATKHFGIGMDIKNKKIYDTKARQQIVSRKNPYLHEILGCS